ncbi:unnamed protein product [marine sediment metagenome]|uniref:Uncharacterized protein n=1 Tax=marine sediment metagenome TaxID=412755 RepID=X1GH33_9ZZZZ
MIKTKRKKPEMWNRFGTWVVSDDDIVQDTFRDKPDAQKLLKKLRNKKY